MAVLAGIVVIAVLSVSCSSAQPPARPEGQASPGLATPPADASPEPRAMEETPSDGRRVPKELRFEAPALSGGTIRGADFAGKDLVVWFWAPW